MGNTPIRQHKLMAAGEKVTGMKDGGSPGRLGLKKGGAPKMPPKKMSRGSKRGG